MRPTKRLAAVLALGLAAASGGLYLVKVHANSAASAARPPAAAEPAPAPTLSVPAGTVLHVRLVQALDTGRSRPGDSFSATLADPVVVDGVQALPKDTVFHGRITQASASGRLRGRAVLAGTLNSLDLNGATYDIETSTVSRVSSSHEKRNLIAIGGGSVVGAVTGALAGGGPGALIGAGAGAAAGTGGAALTGTKNVYLPAETVLSFRLKAPVEVKG